MEQDEPVIKISYGALKKHEMADKIYKIEYINYLGRLMNEVLRTILLTTTMCLLIFIFTKQYTYTMFFIFIAISIYWILLEFIRARQLIHEIKINDNKIVIVGHNYDIPWEEIINIEKTAILIKYRRNGKFDFGIYLRLKYNNKTFDINRTLKWDYLTLKELFIELKKIKNEELNYDERYSVELMEKKGNGFSNFNIILGKDIKKNNTP